ncbi:flavoprotein, partial [Synechococcus sp. BA-120 BA3]|nr:flavoprotein [Synechococcus sp. BA-120 BA3]
MRSEADALAGRRVLVLISGSIAAVKLPQLVSALVQRGALVRCVLSPAAERLVSAVALASLSRAPCHIEADQWSHRESRPLHIALAEWAEVVLVAPLSATSLARWVHGMADTGRTGTPLAAAYFRTKKSASAGISPGRSRSDGRRRLTTFRRYSRSSRNVPSDTARPRSRFDVAMMRMSTLTGVVPPTRSMTRSC